MAREQQCALDDLSGFSILPEEGVSCPFCGAEAERTEINGHYRCTNSDNGFWIEL